MAKSWSILQQRTWTKDNEETMYNLWKGKGGGGGGHTAKGGDQMKPIFEDMPKMRWAMSLDSPEYRYKIRLEKWVAKNKKQLRKALTMTQKALKTAKNPARVGWLWQKKLLEELLGDIKP